MPNKLFLQSALVLLLFHFFPLSSSLAIEDGILAIVNNDVLTLKDLKDYMKGVFSQLRIEGKSPAEINEIMEQYEQKGIQQLVDDKLVLAAADKAGIIIKPSVIDEKIREIESRYETTRQFRDALIKEGLTVSDIRKKITDQFKGQFIIETEVRAKISINPQEVTDYFNAHLSEYENHPRIFLNSIFVNTAFGEAPAREKIEQAMSDIRKGIDFRAVMQTYSELPPVGEIAEADLRPELKDKVGALAIGEVSDILQMDNGFYILKLEGRADGLKASLSAEKDRIYQKLFEIKFRQRFKEWIDGLRQKAYIEIKN